MNIVLLHFTESTLVKTIFNVTGRVAASSQSPSKCVQDTAGNHGPSCAALNVVVVLFNNFVHVSQQRRCICLLRALVVGFVQSSRV